MKTKKPNPSGEAVAEAVAKVIGEDYFAKRGVQDPNLVTVFENLVGDLSFKRETAENRHRINKLQLDLDELKLALLSDDEWAAQVNPIIDAMVDLEFENMVLMYSEYNTIRGFCKMIAAEMVSDGIPPLPRC
jgi:hypothetical protein